MILVIGYGNPLHSDDAIGQHVAWELMRHFDRTDILVWLTYQLMPELAEIISHFDQVVFIDARVGSTPGEVIHEDVRPLAGTGPFTHIVSPAALLSAAAELYGSAPSGLLVSIVGEVFDYGTDLSPRLCRLLPGITGQVAAIIRPYADIDAGEEKRNA